MAKEPGLFSHLLDFLGLPFSFPTEKPLAGDCLVFDFLTQLQSEPRGKLSALKLFDVRYFAQQPPMSPAKALLLLQQLIELCADAKFKPLALHTLNKLLSRQTHRAAAVLLENLGSLSMSSLAEMRLELCPDYTTFEFLGVLEREGGVDLTTVLNGSKEAVDWYRGWTEPSAEVNVTQSSWVQVNWPGTLLEYRLRAGALEVQVSTEVHSSLETVVGCFVKPEKRSVWDLVLARVTQLDSDIFQFEVDAGWSRESWVSQSAVSYQPSGAALSFSGDLSVMRVYLEEQLSPDFPDTEGEVRTKLRYWERMQGALAKIFLNDVAGERQLLKEIWTKFRCVAEGDVSPTTASTPSLQLAVECKTLAPIQSRASERLDVTRDRLARRMF